MIIKKSTLMSDETTQYPKTVMSIAFNYLWHKLDKLFFFFLPHFTYGETQLTDT